MQFTVRAMIFQEGVIVVEILVETVPFSFGDALCKLGIVVALVLLVAFATYAWTNRGKKRGEDELSAASRCVVALYCVLFVASASVVGIVHEANTERHVLNSSDYTSYGVYEATVERATLTDYTVRTDYGAVLTIPYSMGWVDGHVDTGDRVALDVSRMTLGKNQNIIERGGDDMGAMFLRDGFCVSSVDSRGARVPRGVACHRAFGDTEYKEDSIFTSGGGTYYVLTGVSRL